MEVSAMVRGLSVALVVFALFMLYRHYLEQIEKDRRLYFFERGKLAGMQSALGHVRNSYSSSMPDGNGLVECALAWSSFSVFMDDLKCDAPAGHSNGGNLHADAG